jgi:hypothetical protein
MLENENKQYREMRKEIQNMNEKLTKERNKKKKKKN